MRQATTIITTATDGRGLFELSDEVRAWVGRQRIGSGLLTLLCRHTSASLTIQENAARAVRADMLDWLDRIAPEDGGWRHDEEGPDDMPAHLKAALTGVTLSIPVIGGAPALGTWQGIFLVEHRRVPHRRQVALHLIGA